MSGARSSTGLTVVFDILDRGRSTVAVDKDVAVLTDAGRAFQTRDAGTENARSPSKQQRASHSISHYCTPRRK